VHYTPHTQKDITAMLNDIGVADIDELFSTIPESLRLKTPLSFPDDSGKSEQELRQSIQPLLSVKNERSLQGAGIYHHYRPSVIDWVLSRGEFLTAYTPYQPELSQGLLQALYEYQTLICRLTGMEVSNASVYDGSTATVEVVRMLSEISRKSHIAVAATLHPEYKAVLHTANPAGRFEIQEIPARNGIVTPETITETITDQTGGIILQYPNFYGCIEQLDACIAVAHAAHIPVAVAVYPTALGLLKAPGELGAHIVYGEGQPLGLPVSYGGATFGFIATRKKHVRCLPGRICGATVDRNGQRGFVLTLQAREQHIRRQKASSNICSNQMLYALGGAVYLSALGWNGLNAVARTSADKAHRFVEHCTALPGISLRYTHPYFNEFVLDIPNMNSIRTAIKERLHAEFGIPLARFTPNDTGLLIAVTEMTDEQLLTDIPALIGELL